MKEMYKEISADVELGACAFPRTYRPKRSNTYYRLRQIGAALILLFPLVLFLFAYMQPETNPQWTACFKEVKWQCHNEAECLEESIAECDTIPSHGSGTKPLPLVAAYTNLKPAFQLRMQTEN